MNGIKLLMNFRIDFNIIYTKFYSWGNSLSLNTKSLHKSSVSPVEKKSIDQG